ncbi:MAG: right-handed parallel beta-helix repeat-containing protein, partial [Nanoarchaeota archaeon]|nr:right-handed parallel beta-helix repeat-containing protein [Nanoarchaeota archaeon]
MIYPSNVTLEVGSEDGIHEFNQTGNFTTINTTDDFSAEIQSYIDDNCTANLWENCSVPLKLHSDSVGKIEISNINIQFTNYYWNVSNLAYGIYYRFNVTPTDGYDNGTSDISNADFTIGDIVPPSVYLESPANNTVNTTTNTIDFFYNVTDATSSIANCSLIINSNINATVSSPAKDQTNNITIDLANGNYNWSVNCTDSSNNEGESETWNLSVNFGDITPPTVTLLSPANASTSTSPVTFSFNITENGVCSLYLNTSGTFGINTTNNSVIAGDNNFVVGLSDDTSWLWNVECNDSAGNYANASENWTLTIDATAPTVTLLYPANSSTNDSAITTFGFNTTENGACSLYLNTSGTFGINTTNNSITQADNNFVVTLTPDADWLWNIECNDSAGNYANASDNWTLTIDTTAPGINFTSPTPANGTTQSETSVEINISITESTLDNFTFNWNSTNYTFYDDSLVLMMNFDNVSAIGENYNDSLCTVYDSSSYGNNGTLQNGTYNTTGKYGGALSFDGVGEFIEIPDDPPLSAITKGSVSLWFKTSVWGDYIGFISKQWNGGGSEWGIGQHSGKVWVELCGDNSQSNYRQRYGTSTGLNDNAWHHLAVTWNGFDENNIHIYVDGSVEDGSTLSGGSGSMIDTSEKVRIGVKHSTPYCFNGTIDEVRIYNRTLSTAEIQQHYFSNLKKYDTDKWEFYTNQSKNSIDGLDDGTYTYYGYAKDNVGNENSTETRTLTIDATVPTVTLLYPANASTNTSATITFGFNTTENGACSLYLNTSGVWGINTTNNSVIAGGNNFVVTLTPDASWLWNVECNDSAGNYANASDNWTLTIDATAPPAFYCSNNALNNTANADFRITTNVICNAEEIVLGTDSDITIAEGGNLTFMNNTNLTFSMTADGGSYINKTPNGGLWIIENTSITSNNSAYEYNFWVWGNGGNDNFTLKYSKITGCGYDTGGSYGLQLYNVSDIVIEGNNISDGGWSGLYLVSSANNNITNNTIYNFVHGIELEFCNNFYIENNTIHDTQSGTGISLISSDNNTITNSEVYTKYQGIRLDDSDNNTITGNEAYNNTNYGILIYNGSDNNNVTGNTLYDNNSYGIGMITNSDNNNVIGNIVYNNSDDGIQLSSSSNNNTVTSNTVYNNSKNGIELSSSSNNNTVTSNTVYNNSDDGISIQNSNNNKFINNTISGIIDISGDGVISLSNSDNNEFINNTISKSASAGFYIYSNSDNNIIKNNFINNSGSGYDNIYIDGVSASDTADNTTIENNNITFSGRHGIYVYQYSENNTIKNNTILNSTFAGILIGETSTDNQLITGGSIINNSIGINVTGASGINLTNVTIEDSVNLDLFIITNSSVIAENCTFNKTKVNVSNGVANDLSNFTVKWYEKAYVFSTGGAITGASVTAVNLNSSGFDDFNDTTTNGYTSIHTMADYLQNATELFYYTYNFTANKTNYINNSNVTTITDYRTINIQINSTADITPPTVTLLFPANSTTNNSAITTFGFNTTENGVCSLYLNTSGTFGINITNSSVIAGDNNFVVGLSDDTSWLWNIECNDSAGNY